MCYIPREFMVLQHQWSKWKCFFHRIP